MATRRINFLRGNSGAVRCSYVRPVAGSSPIAVPLLAPRSTAPPESPSLLTGLPLTGQEKLRVFYVGRNRHHLGVPLAQDRHVEQSSVWNPHVGQQPPIDITGLYV